MSAEVAKLEGEIATLKAQLSALESKFESLTVTGPWFSGSGSGIQFNPTSALQGKAGPAGPAGPEGPQGEDGLKGDKPTAAVAECNPDGSINLTFTAWEPS